MPRPTEMLRTSLVNPGRSNKVLRNASLVPGPDGEPNFAPLHAFEDAAQALQSLTMADTAVILDLRAFHAPFPPDHFVHIALSLVSRPTGLDAPIVTTPLPSEDLEELVDPSDVSSLASPGIDSRHAGHDGVDSSEGGSDRAGGFTGEASRWGARFSGVAPGAGVITVLGSGGQHNWDAAASSPGCKPAVSHSLVAFYSVGSLHFVLLEISSLSMLGVPQDQMCEFDSGTVPSPLSDFLPPNTEASLSVRTSNSHLSISKAHLSLQSQVPVFVRVLSYLARRPGC